MYLRDAHFKNVVTRQAPTAIEIHMMAATATAKHSNVIAGHVVAGTADCLSQEPRHFWRSYSQQ
jgi:hypothetical protein